MRTMRRKTATMASWALAVAAPLLTSAGATAWHGASAAAAEERARPGAAAALLARAARLGAALEELEHRFEARVAPLERVLRAHAAEPWLARRIAVALVREAAAVDISPRLLLAVLLVENPPLDPAARSPVGAHGLMQVMPLHLGQWPACVPSLDDIDGNICHGARIFAAYLRREAGDVERALLRYNGCVNGTNTPGCRGYARRVFERAQGAERLAGLGG